MSMFLQAEEGPPVEVATNTGWRLFTEAVEAAWDDGELRSLVDEGISEDPKELTYEVQEFLNDKPDKNLAGIARNVMDFLEGSPRLVMTSDGRELDVGGEEPTGPDRGLPETINDFNPNQPRDEKGRWGKGGASGFSTSEEWFLSLSGEEQDATLHWGGPFGAGLLHMMDNGDYDKTLKKTDPGRYKELKKETDAFISAVSKAPKFTGTAYRGIVLEDKDYASLIKSKKIGVRGISSFSQSEKLALKYAKGGGYGVGSHNVMIVAKVKDGRDIRAIPKVPRDQEEIAVRRENYKVSKIVEKGGVTYVYVD